MTTVVIDKQAQRKSRIKLLGVLFIFAGPLFLAFVWLQLVKNDVSIVSSSNGELIKPATPLEAFSLSNSDKGEFGLDELKGSWTMLYFTDGACEEICQQNLYHMRQVRLSLAQNMDRVQRIAIVQNATDINMETKSQHDGLHVIGGTSAEIAGIEKQIRDAESGMPVSKNAIYIVDPLGNLMMRFPADLNPKGMLKDLKHLLKVSRIG